jgi:NAD(P)-dependent dehydrogenase (short-subunit alcohol dehydrogenase family)
MQNGPAALCVIGHDARYVLLYVNSVHCSIGAGGVQWPYGFPLNRIEDLRKDNYMRQELENSAAASAPYSLNLDGTVCVVTGAGSGIGAGIARAFASVGAHVALVDRNLGAEAVAAELRHAGAVAQAIGCDVSDEASVAEAAGAVRAALGPASVLVNNAGLLRAGPLDTVSIADWNQAIAVNLTGYLLCARAFGADMLAAGKGSIVHVASIAALNPQTNSGSYSPSKAGVLLLSRQLAAEWGPRAGCAATACCPA